MAQSSGLKSHEIRFIVREWIGTDPDPSSGLAWFTHEQLSEFLGDDCGLPQSHPGVAPDCGLSKRDRLQSAISQAVPRDQATILENMLSRADVDPPPGDIAGRQWYIRRWIDELGQASGPLDSFEGPVPDVARRALDDVTAQAAKGEYLNAVDRSHTALHACVKALAIEAKVDIEEESGLLEQFAAVRASHPAFVVQKGDRATADIIKGVSRALDGINAMRNKHSLAHPSAEPLEPAEARLAVNAGCALLQYIIDRTEVYNREGPMDEIDSDDLPFE